MSVLALTDGGIVQQGHWGTRLVLTSLQGTGRDAADEERGESKRRDVGKEARKKQRRGVKREYGMRRGK